MIIFLLGLNLALWTGGGGFQEKETKEGEKKSLIKKELLERKKRELEPPRRNIFSLRSRTERNPVVPPVRSKQRSQKDVRDSNEKPTRKLLDIEYIGHITSGEKIVALIILEGDVLTVEKGDFIGDGVRIGEVTTLAVEIIGPDLEKRKVYLRGERE